MTTIQLYCRGASAWTKVDGRITRGMVGLNVAIVCDKSWAGLTKSLVARNGDGERWVLAAVGDTAVVPHEALQEEGHLYLCLEGRDGDGHLVLPSNWASCGRIYDSGGGKPGTAAATPTELQQLMVLADQAKRTAEEALRRSGQGEGNPQGGVTEDWVKEQGYLKESALSEAVDDALEQAKNSGAFDGADGVTPNLQIGTVTTLEAGASATASITGTKEEPRLNLGIPAGTQGFSGGTGTAEKPTVLHTWSNKTTELETGGSTPRPNFLYASGNRLYAGGKYGRLKLYDVTDKTSPRLVTETAISGLDTLYCTGLAGYGDYVISTWRAEKAGLTLNAGANNGAVIIHDKATLETIDSITYTDRKCARVVIDGDDCVITWMNFGFAVYRIENGRPVQKYADFTPSSPATWDNHGAHIFSHGGRRYVAIASMGYGMRIHDITNPASPFKAWEWKFNAFPFGYNAHDFDVYVEYPKIYAPIAQNDGKYGVEPDMHGLVWADISAIDGMTSAPAANNVPGPAVAQQSTQWGYVNFPLELMNRTSGAWPLDTMPTRMVKTGNLLALNTSANNIAFFSIGSNGIPVYKDYLEVFPSRNEIIYPLYADGAYLYCGTQNALDVSGKVYGNLGIIKMPSASGSSINGGTTGGNTVTGNALDKGSTCYDALQIKLIPGDASKATATYNTTTLNNWLAEVKTGHPEYGRRSLHFGAGDWYFNDTILVDKGQCASIFSDAIPTKVNAPCRLHFDGMPVHRPAMRLTSCSPQNIGIYGDRTNYHYDIDRTDIMAHQGHPELCYTETGADLLTDSGGVDSRTHDDFIKNSKDNLATRSIGIEIMGGDCLLSHVVIMDFYTGIWTHPGNMELRDIQPCYCHYGIVNNSDTQVVNCRPYKCHVGWVINGPLIHGIGYRTDSVYTSVWATSGRWTIESLDADWCLGPALRLSGTVNAFTVNGLTSRCCTANWFDRKDENGNLISMLPDYNLDGLKWDSTGKAPGSGIGWVHVDNDALVRGGYITYTSVNPHNPNDGTPPDYPERNYQCIQNELYIGEGSYVEMQINVSHPSWRGITAEDVVKYHIRNDNNYDRTRTGRYGTIIVHSPYDTIRVDQQVDKSCLLASAFSAGDGVAGIDLDDTLSKDGKAADAGAVGEAFEREFSAKSGKEVYLLEQQDIDDLNVLKDGLTHKLDIINPQPMTAEQQTTLQQSIGIVALTQEEYDLIETPDPNVYYFIVDGDTT